MVQASSSVIVDGTWGTMPVPGLPFLMTQNNSPSVRFFWKAQFVKLRGDGLSIIPPGPLPFPSRPWQFRHVPLPSYRAFPLSIFSGVAGMGFGSAFTFDRALGGTRGLIGSRYSATAPETVTNISTDKNPRDLAKHSISAFPCMLRKMRGRVGKYSLCSGKGR